MSKLTVQKNIPNGWKETKLSELLVEVNERNRERAELPVLSVTNSRGFVLQSEQFARNLHSKNTSNYKIVSKEQFAYNPARINVGSIALLRKWEQGLLSPMYVVFGTKGELLNDYLHYYIQSPRFSVQVSNNTAGSVRKSLNFNAFEHFDYVYPESKQEQKKIVEVLASVDEEIEKTKEVIKATEKLRKGLMQKLFTRGIGHTKFKKTELGEIPEIWEIEPMSKILSFQGGFAFKSTDAADAGVPWLKIANVSFGKTDWSTKSYLPNRFKEINKEFLLKKGEVVMAMTRPVLRGKIKAAKLTEQDVPALLNQRVGKFVFDSSVNSEYLYQFIFSSYFAKEVTLKIRGNDPPNISSSQIETILVPLPNKEEQKKIAEILTAVDEKMSVNKKLLAKQTELKKGLMQDLLSGVKRMKV